MAAPAELNKVLGALLKAPSKKIWDELEEFLPDGQSEVTPNEKGMRSIKKLIEMFFAGPTIQPQLQGYVRTSKYLSSRPR
eukprot:1378068-Amorphochlora_amoeboformis.AAC.2